MRVTLTTWFEGGNPGEIIDVDDVQGRVMVADGQARPAPDETTPDAPGPVQDPNVADPNVAPPTPPTPPTTPVGPPGDSVGITKPGDPGDPSATKPSDK